MALKDHMGSILGPAERSAADLKDEAENPEIVNRAGQISRLLREIRTQEPY